MYSIALVRHCFPDLASPDPDPPLSSYGRLQAASLRPHLERTVPTITWIISSPLRRAFETAAAIGGDICPPEVVNQAAPGSGDALVGRLVTAADGLVVVTHEDVINDLVRALTGTDAPRTCPRSGYVAIRRGTKGWTTNFEAAVDV